VILCTVITSCKPVTFQACCNVKHIITERVVCYYGSWSVYRPGNGSFEVEYIDPNICTHGIYAFVGLGEDWGVRILDSWKDINLGKFRMS